MYLQVSTDDEREWIRRCLEGDADAFEPLVERYHRPLFKVAARLLGDREEARDVIQIAFLKAYQALATCDTKRRFFSWIYRIVVNECLNTVRSRKHVEALDEEIAAPARGGDRLEAEDTRRRVRRALVHLTPEQRDVIVMRHFAEMSYEEVAAALGVPEKTVKSRLFAARQRLCELLAVERV